MQRIKSTKGQRKKLCDCHVGVGLLVYHAGNNETVEFEFFIRDGKLRYVENGEPVEFHVAPEE